MHCLNISIYENKVLKKINIITCFAPEINYGHTRKLSLIKYYLLNYMTPFFLFCIFNAVCCCEPAKYNLNFQRDLHLYNLKYIMREGNSKNYLATVPRLDEWDGGWRPKGIRPQDSTVAINLVKVIE